MRHLTILLSFCLIALIAGAAVAAEMAYAIPDLAWPGMSIAKLRTKVPPGLRLYCGTDRNVQVGEADRIRLTVPGELAMAGVDRCGVFAAAMRAKTFEAQQIKLGDNPADFWVLALVDGNGVQRVVQIELAQPNTSFAATLDYFSQLYGPPQQSSTTAAHWKNGRGEAVVKANAKGLMQIFLIDNELQALMSERIADAHPQQ